MAFHLRTFIFIHCNDILSHHINFTDHIHSTNEGCVVDQEFPPFPPSPLPCPSLARGPDRKKTPQPGKCVTPSPAPWTSMLVLYAPPLPSLPFPISLLLQSRKVGDPYHLPCLIVTDDRVWSASLEEEGCQYKVFLAY